MTDLRKAAEQALEALEEINKLSVGEKAVCLPAEIDGAMEALRQALAQPEQEPECVATIGNWGKVEWRHDVYPQLGDKLYTAPPKKEWVGLTDDEVAQAMYRADAIITGPMQFKFAKEIESKLKEKNT